MENGAQPHLAAHKALFNRLRLDLGRSPAESAALPTDERLAQYREVQNDPELKRIKAGSLVSPNGWSHEHGPVEDACMHDQQLIRELKDKVGLAATWEAQAAGTSSAAASDAELALVALGFKQAEARKSIAALVKDNPAATTDELIRGALRHLG